MNVKIATVVERSIQAEWDRLDPGELRGLLMALAAKVVITSKGTLEYEWREPSAFVPAAGKASEGLKRLALPPTDAAPPMLPAVNAPTDKLI